MAINYTKIGWDTSKYVNPTNMNQMDDGIKAACDGVDAHDTAISNLNTAVGGRVKLSNATVQEIETTGTSAFPISLKGGYTGESLIRYRDGSGNTLGYMGIASGDKPVFYGASGVTTKEIALKDDFLFDDIGDCQGSDATLNSMIQTYCLNQPLGIHFARVNDNVGSSTIGGGVTSLIILKSVSGYYPIFGIRYPFTNVAGAILYVGSIYDNVFTGFVRITQ